MLAAIVAPSGDQCKLTTGDFSCSVFVALPAVAKWMRVKGGDMTMMRGMRRFTRNKGEERERERGTESSTNFVCPTCGRCGRQRMRQVVYRFQDSKKPG